MMSAPPRLELITSGAELLNGAVLNRHAQWLGREAAGLGWELHRDTTVPDDPAALREAMFSALARVEVLVVSGGLGPTSDDVTRDVAADWAGVGVVMHEPTRAVVHAAYAARNKPLNDLVERHALVVDGAEVWPNTYGLAPGEHLTRDGRHLFLLPGPPREFQGVARDFLLPWLAARHPAGPVRRQDFSVIGWGESDLAARLNADGLAGLAVEVAYCAAPARVLVRLAERSGGGEDFDRAVALVRGALGGAVYAEADEPVEVTVVRALEARGVTLALAESCTGGLIGARLTELAGVSRVLRGGVVCYHNELKVGLLGVPEAVLAAHGAVSEPVARAMAEGARRVGGADLGLAVTGVAGPDGGTAEKPVGLVYVACADGRGTVVRELRLGGPRSLIRESAASMALDLVRRQLVGG
jgi:nicotinamide-nucleotide amidase